MQQGDWGVSTLGFNELTRGGIGGGALFCTEVLGTIGTDGIWKLSTSFFVG